MPCTRDWGMLAPPAKIGQSQSFPFAFWRCFPSCGLPQGLGDGQEGTQRGLTSGQVMFPSVSPGEILSQDHAL